MCRKRGFKTVDEAALFIISVRSWGRQAPYKCDECEWFHNSSKPKTVKRFLAGTWSRKVSKYMDIMGGDADPFSKPNDDEECRPIVVAGFTSPCSWGDVIYEGEDIRHDGEGGWEHVECGKAESAVVNDDSMDDPEFEVWHPKEWKML